MRGWIRHVFPDALNDKATTALHRCSVKIRKCAGLQDMYLQLGARSLRRCWRTARAWRRSGSCLGTARRRRAHAMRISREIPCMKRLAKCLTDSSLTCIGTVRQLTFREATPMKNHTSGKTCRILSMNGAVGGGISHIRKRLQGRGGSGRTTHSRRAANSAPEPKRSPA